MPRSEGELLNVTLTGGSIAHRRITRMLITGTMDAAARAEKIGRHKLTGIRLTESRATPAPGDDKTTRPGDSCSSPTPRSGS